MQRRQRSVGSNTHARVRSVDVEVASPKRPKLGRDAHDVSLWRLLLAACGGVVLVQLLVGHSTPDALVRDELTAEAPIPRELKLVHLDVGPPPRPAPTAETRYLAYFPHSGYHNQRISLENALTLAYMLNRTLLVPPARLGNAIPYISFDKLYHRTNQATKVGLDHCRNSSDVLARECIGYFDWTSVAWDFLVDFDLAKSLVPVVDRWDGTWSWLQSELGIRKADIHHLRDERLYQYRVYDSLEDDAGLDKFDHRLDLRDLRELDRYRLLHVGTLFGTSRLRTTVEDIWEARSRFRKAMVFRNPMVDRVTDAVQSRLGGEAGYYGLHLRVGDGLFLKHARRNARDVLRRLCQDKMKMPVEVVNEVLGGADAPVPGVYEPPTKLEKREVPAETEEPRAVVEKRDPPRANSRPQRANAYHHAPLPALPRITSRGVSPLHPSLTCRGPFYTEERLLKLNAPVFLATDSRSPTSDPNLTLLFETLPCLFVLGDFSTRSPTEVNTEPIAELGELDGLRNGEDGVALAPFLFPIVDMVIAAKGRAVVGTQSSTFSRFAVDVLHQVYHGWDAIERG